MILADTSVWIAHFRKALPFLPELVASGDLRMHPFIIGELALGSVPDRRKLLEVLGALPTLVPALPTAILEFIETEVLFGTGIGYVDAHLLKSCADSADRLWTRDKSLAEQAARLSLSFREEA